MREAWKKNIYIAKKKKDPDGNDIIDDYGKVQYEKPKLYRMNVLPLGGTTNVATARTRLRDYGEKPLEMQRAILDYKQWYGKFETDDLAYLDGASPKGEIVNGYNANYRIDSVLNQNKVILIYFERLSEK